MELKEFINGAEPQWKWSTYTNEEVGIRDFISCDLETANGNTIIITQGEDSKGRFKYFLPQFSKRYASVQACRKYLKKNRNEPLHPSEGRPPDSCWWREGGVR